MPDERHAGKCDIISYYGILRHSNMAPRIEIDNPYTVALMFDGYTDGERDHVKYNLCDVCPVAVQKVLARAKIGSNVIACETLSSLFDDAVVGRYKIEADENDPLKLENLKRGNIAFIKKNGLCLQE